MLTYLLEDELRIFGEDFSPGKIDDMEVSQAMFVGLAALMLIPIVMVLLSLILGHPAICWVGIGAAAFLFLFNAVGLPTYPSAYDKFLVAVGLVINLVTIWYSWKWV